MHYNLLQTWLPHAGNIEILQVLLVIVGLLFEWFNLREVWLDFRVCRASGARWWQVLLDFLLPGRWDGARTKTVVTARANMMSSWLKACAQVLALGFGLWSLTVEPPPPARVLNIFADSVNYGPALLGKEAVIIAMSLLLMLHSIHERRARRLIDSLPYGRRATDAPAMDRRTS